MKIGDIVYDKKKTALEIFRVDSDQSFSVLYPSIQESQLVGHFQTYQVGRDIFLSAEDVDIPKNILRQDPRYQIYFDAWNHSSRRIRFSKDAVPKDLEFEKKHYSDICEYLDNSLSLLIDDLGDGSPAKAEYFCFRGENRYLQDRARIMQQKNEPYFARVDYAAENGVYIGKEEINKRVIDWTDERAAMYYEYSLYVQNDKYNLGLVRNYSIDNGGFHNFSDLYVKGYDSVSADSTDKETEAQQQPGQKTVVADPHLLKLLESNRSRKGVHDIIQSIQLNQYQIITKPFNEASIVIGCAGSGKTMILYHRIRYMLRNASSIRPDQVMIIAPTKSLNTEGQALSEELHLEKTLKYSTVELYQNLIARYLERYELIRTPDRNLQITMSAQMAEDAQTDIFYSGEYSDLIVAAVADVLTAGSDAYNAFIRACNTKFKEKTNILFTSETDIALQQINGDYELSRVLSNYEQMSEIFKKMSPECVYYEKKRIAEICESEKQKANEEFSLLDQRRKQKDADISKTKEKLRKLRLEIDRIEKEREESERANPIGALLTKFRDKRLRSTQHKDEDLASYESMLKEKKKELSDEELRLRGLNEALIEFKDEPDRIKERLEAVEVDCLRKDKIMNFVSEHHYLKGAQTVNSDMTAVYAFFDCLDDYQKHAATPFRRLSEDNVMSVLAQGLRLKTEIEEYLRFKDSSMKEFYIDYAFEYVMQQQKEVFDLDTDKIYDFELYEKLYVLSANFGEISEEKYHIFLDEFQDYSPTELELIAYVFPQGVFNLYGDYRQCISAKGVKDKAQLPQFLADADCYEVNENYRNPLEITEYVNEKFGLQMTAIGIHGSVSEMDRLDLTDFDRHAGDRTAIIYKEPKVLAEMSVAQGNPLFRFITDKQSAICTDKVNVLHIQQAKGMEFEKVYLLREAMTDAEQYVAMTRALSEIVIIDHGKYNKGAKHRNTHLNPASPVALKTSEMIDNTIGERVTKFEAVPRKDEKNLIPKEWRQDAIEIWVSGVHAGQYFLVPYNGKLKKHVKEPTVNMFIPQMRSDKEKLVPVSVVEEDHIIYILKENFKTYGKGITGPEGIQLRTTYFS